MTTRRSFLIGAGASFLAAPAIVRAASLMPVKAPRILTLRPAWLVPMGQTLKKSEYPELARILENTWGGDELTFKLPDLGITPPADEPAGREETRPRNPYLLPYISTETGDIITRLHPAC